MLVVGIAVLLVNAAGVIVILIVPRSGSGPVTSPMRAIRAVFWGLPR